MRNDDRDLLIRTILGEHGDKPDDYVAGFARDIANEARDGSVGDAVLRRGRFPSWTNNARALLRVNPESGPYQRVAQIVNRAIGNDAAPESDDEFQKRWGVVSPSKATVVKAPPVEQDADFEKRWAVDPASAAAAAIPSTNPDVRNPTGAASALTGGFTRGIPIAGPILDTAAQKVAARIRSTIYGTPYSDELKAVSEYAGAAQKEHPKTELAGNIAGGVTALAPVAIAAPSLLGLQGTLAARTLAGAGSGAVINALDSAVRSGGDPRETAIGAAIGGTMGGVAPAAGALVGAGANKLMRTAVDPMTNYLAQKAAQFGIPIRPPQISTSPFINKVDQMVGQLPGSGQGKVVAQQQDAFTRAVSGTFGENTDSITPSVMRAAKKRLGGEFDAVTKAMSIKPDTALASHIGDIADESRKFLTSEESRIITSHLRNLADKFGPTGEMPGEAYHALVRKGSPLDRAIKSPNSNIAHYATEIRSALDDAAQRSSPPELSARLSEARRQYKNMKTIQPLVTKGVPGEINALALQNRVNMSFPNRAFTGAGDLGDLADIGQRFMRQPRDSGTPIGNVIMRLMAQHGTLLGGLALGGGGAGGAYLSGEDPLKGLALGLGGLGGTAATARVVSSVLNNPNILRVLVNKAPLASVPTKNALSPNP